MRKTMIAGLASLALVAGAGVVGITAGAESTDQAGPACKTTLQSKKVSGSTLYRHKTECPLVRGGSYTTYTAWYPWKP